MNEMILVKEARVAAMMNYNGVCHKCNSPITYTGRMQVLELEDKANEIVCFALDVLMCPHCMNRIGQIRVYKTLEVTEELAAE